MNAWYISLIFNILFLIAFIVDRLFRLNSIKEYKEARDAQINLLKEKIEFIEKYNDEFITEKYRKSVDNLKLIVADKELEIESNKQGLTLLKHLQERYEKEQADYNNNNEAFKVQIQKLEEKNVLLFEELNQLNGKVHINVADTSTESQKLINYSLALSHNIRKPIATLKGLLSLYNEKLIDEQEYISLVEKCVNEADDVIIKNMSQLDM